MLTNHGSDIPFTSNEPDIAAIKTVLEEILTEGKEIVRLAHSYAITPVYEAVKGLGLEERETLGKLGGVVNLIIVTA